MSDELYHYGVKGMKWGHRKSRIQLAREARRSSQTSAAANTSRDAYAQAKQAYKQAKKAERNSPEAKAERAARAKRAAKIGAVAAGTALAAYGAYKLNKYVKTKNCQIAAERGVKEAEKLFAAGEKRAVEAVKRGATRASTTVNVGDIALLRAHNASGDSFRTAARNVANYKKSGGNLKTLYDLEMYKNMRPWEAVYGR